MRKKQDKKLFSVHLDYWFWTIIDFEPLIWRNNLTFELRPQNDTVIPQELQSWEHRCKLFSNHDCWIHERNITGLYGSKYCIFEGIETTSLRVCQKSGSIKLSTSSDKKKN